MESLALTEMTETLLDKYQYILGKHASNKKLSIENIVENIIKYYESITGCMPGNVYWLDKNGVAIGCNTNVLNMFGLHSLSEFKGLSFEDMGRIGNWTKAAELSFKNDTLEVVKSGKSKLNIEEPPIPHLDGRVIYFLTSRVPLYDQKGNVVGVVGISIDITELKNTQASLKKAKEQAETANQLKSEFIRNMEHDIRTPFGGIWGLANILYEQESDQTKKELLGDIANSAKELLDYCNSILDFSKVEAGTLPVLEKKFNLPELVNGVIAIEKPAIAIKHLQFEFEYDSALPTILLGDPYRLKRILINLISNSVKFTNDGHINFKVKLVKKTDSRRMIIRFIVEDSGIGMQQEKQNLIYEKFVRLTSSNQGIYKGLGLGLRVVKQFMDEMGGDIELNSALGKGTIFICTIPFKLPLIEDIPTELMESY
ncbi:MAG: putative Histidine kinase [Gammaproteobacteria bacterium]|jgi:PAS domain S-box-containing protein|nr:putative Histidine kinase [Gammaproteobacteria bacterium]